MMSEGLAKLLENAEYHVIIDGVKIGELKIEEEEDDGKIHVTQLSDRIIVSRDGMILDEFIEENYGEESVELFESDQEPSVVCVRERTKYNSFVSALGTGGTSRYYADEYEIDENHYLNVLSDGEVVAVHLMENVERIWFENAVVKKEDEDEDD